MRIDRTVDGDCVLLNRGAPDGDVAGLVHVHGFGAVHAVISLEFATAAAVILSCIDSQISLKALTEKSVLLSLATYCLTKGLMIMSLWEAWLSEYLRPSSAESAL
jgi:hypothetical protein